MGSRTQPVSSTVGCFPFSSGLFFFPLTGTFQLVSVSGELGKPPGIGVGRCGTVAVIMNDLEKEGFIRSHNSRLKPINFGESGRPETETAGYIVSMVSMQEQGEMNAGTPTYLCLAQWGLLQWTGSSRIS